MDETIILLVCNHAIQAFIDDCLMLRYRKENSKTTLCAEPAVSCSEPIFFCSEAFFTVLKEWLFVINGRSAVTKQQLVIFLFDYFDSPRSIHGCALRMNWSKSGRQLGANGSSTPDSSAIFFL